MKRVCYIQDCHLSKSLSNNMQIYGLAISRRVSAERTALNRRRVSNTERKGVAKEKGGRILPVLQL